MKDLNMPEIRKYEVPFPPTPQDQVGLGIHKVIKKDYSIPRDNGEILKVIIGSYSGITKVAVSAFGMTDDGDKTIRAVTTEEVKLVRDIFLSDDEALIWTYDYKSRKLVNKAVREYTKMPFDMSSFSIHFVVAKDFNLPFEAAYAKKVQKNRGYRYCRGNIGSYKFIHLETKNPILWADLEIISNKEYPKSRTCVIFSAQTEAYPNDYIIWESQKSE